MTRAFGAIARYAGNEEGKIGEIPAGVLGKLTPQDVASIMLFSLQRASLEAKSEPRAADPLESEVDRSGSTNRIRTMTMLHDLLTLEDTTAAAGPPPAPVHTTQPVRTPMPPAGTQRGRPVRPGGNSDAIPTPTQAPANGNQRRPSSALRQAIQDHNVPAQIEILSKYAAAEFLFNHLAPDAANGIFSVEERATIGSILQTGEAGRIKSALTIAEARLYDLAETDEPIAHQEVVSTAMTKYMASR